MGTHVSAHGTDIAYEKNATNLLHEMAKKRILTGDRPTGKLHLGHYVGTLKNRVRLQGDYECFFIVADLHTLTTAVEREKIAGAKLYDL